MKKQYGYVIMIMCIFCELLGGCGSGDAVNEGDAGKSTAKDKQEYESELTLYCMANSPEVDQAILEFREQYETVQVIKTEFEDSEQMDEKIKLELNAGKGPDVIIFNSETSLDVLGMAKNGAFQALDDKLAEDESLDVENYLPGTFEAGQVRGKTYVLPLTFSVPYVMYDKTAELGLEPETVISFADYCEAVGAELERLKEEEDYEAVFGEDYYSVLMTAANLFTVSAEEQTITYEPELLQMAIEQVAAFSAQTEKTEKLLTRYKNKELEIGRRFTFIWNEYLDEMYYAWAFLSLYREAGKEEIQFSLIETADGSGVVAEANSYGVLTKNAGPYAYEFLRAAMDANADTLTDGYTVYRTSVNKNTIAGQLSKYRYRTGFYGSKDDRVMVKGFAVEKEGEQLTELYDSITDVVIVNPTIQNICREAFRPYMVDGSKTYEECYKEFEQKIALYMGE